MPTATKCIVYVLTLHTCDWVGDCLRCICTSNAVTLSKGSSYFFGVRLHLPYNRRERKTAHPFVTYRAHEYIQFFSTPAQPNTQ